MSLCVLKDGFSVLQVPKKIPKNQRVWCEQSRLAEVREHRVDELEGLIDLLSDLGASEDNLAGDEDEEHLNMNVSLPSGAK